MSLQRYGEYKDCRVAWLGKLPTHWAVVRVKHVTGSIEQGWSPQCEGFPVETPDEWGVMKVGCVNGGRFRPSENKKLPVELQPMPQYALKRGDLLISRANTRELVGSAAVVQDDLDNLLLCDKLYRLRANEGMNQAKYLAYFLGTREARSQIELDATGASSSMLNIGQSAILDLLMPRPSAAEQAAITTFLDRETAKIDALIADQEKLIALLAEKRQATISHAVTKGLNPDVPMKDSGVAWLGEVPEHWDVVTFQRCIYVQEGQVDPEVEPYCSMLLIAPNHIESGTGRLLFAETAQEQAAESGKYLCKSGDVIYSKIRPALRKVCIAPEDCLCSADMYPLRGISTLSNAFLMWFMLSESFSALAVLESERVAMPKINRESLKAVWVTVPTQQEQKGIVEFLMLETGKLDALRGEAEQAISLLRERRSALITAAVTGQIDVRHLVQGGPA
ncbi:restriction endonuclease subunit S [Comamonas testosteroni]|uniref:restriction endonuclease subunit S n=1 Tax=Comamonas testosteroni TaxID=285 RepID=UPI001E3B73CF|nr:restriction endonuclease subunit S [Comamonas testosteroni]